MADDELLIVPVPALVAVLLALENKKGSPLTEEDVLIARDQAASIAMPASIRDEIAASRGYDDINPENVWKEWQEVRKNLG